MTCREAQSLLTAYVDQELSGVDRQTYEHHLLHCDQCFRASRTESRFKAAIRGHLPHPAVPASLAARVKATLDAEPQPTARRWPWQLFPRFFPAFAATVALFVLVVGARTRRSPIWDQAVRAYTSGIPLDVVGKDCKTIAADLRKYVNFFLKPPTVGEHSNCHGGRLIDTGNGYGAYFVVERQGLRIGVLVYPEDADGTFRLKMRSLGQAHHEPAYVESGRGTSLAVVHGDDGLEYVYTAATDSDELTNYVRSNFQLTGAR